MKAFLLPLLAALASASAQASIISSVERLDSSTSSPVLVHSLPQAPTFSLGMPVWSDYSFQFRSVPNYLIGADAVRTGYLIDAVDADFQMRITLEVPATVYLLIDDRAPDVVSAMPWVSSLGFVDTGDNAVIQVSPGSVLTTASVYRASFPAGQVVLREQHDTSGTSGMYTVAAVPEPSVVSLLLAGAGCGLRRWRRPTVGNG